MRSVRVVCLVAVASTSCGDDGKMHLVDGRPEVDTSGPVDVTPPAPLLQLAPLTFDFGSIAIGATSQPRSFVLTNAGTASATVAAPTVSGSDFAIQSTTCTGALAAGSSCEVRVAFSPTAIGPAMSTLSVGGSTAALDGAGIAAGGQIAIAPASADLGTAVVGATGSTQTFTLTNSGGQPTSAIALQASGSDPTQFTKTTDSCSGQIVAAGASCSFAIAFAPTSSGAKSVTFTALASATATASVAVSAIGLAPAQLAVAPAVQDFGTVVVGGQSGNVAFTVVNAGGVATGAPTAAVTGSGAGAFQVASNSCTAALDPGANCTIVVRFSPSAMGAAQAALAITGVPGGSVEAQLSGTGAVPGALAVQPSAIAFGNATVGQTTPTTMVTITNTGGAAIGPLSTTLATADFTASANACLGATLQPAASCTLALAFSPSAAGAKSATLVVSGSGGTVTVGLTGAGIPAAQLAIAPSTKDFGSVGLGTASAFQTFTITNTGGVATGAPTAQLAGAQFALVNGCTAPLAPLASCDVEVRFVPTAVGAATASLSVSASPGGSTSASLFGTGADPAQLTVLPGSLAFQTLLGDTAQQTFTVKNSGAVTSGTIVVSKSGASAAEFDLTNTTCATLDPGATCTVTVRFAPTAIGAHAATAIIAASPGGSTTVALSGSVKPRLEIISVAGAAPPDSYDFGNVVVGAFPAPSAAVVVRNNTAAAQTIAVAAEGAQFAVVGSPCSAPVASGATCTAQVAFAPTSVGVKTGDLAFSIGGAPADRATQPLAGTGIDGLVIEPTSGTDFGNVARGTTSPPLQLTLRNASTTVVTGQLQITGLTAPFSLSTDTCSGTTLAGGASCTLAVVFAPTFDGLQQTTLTASASPGGSPLVDLRGTGVDPNALIFNPSPAAFGNVFSGTTKDVTVVVTNPAGAQTAGPLAFNLAGDAALTLVGGASGDCTAGLVLSNGQSCNLRLHFAPTALGAKAATLTVTASPGTPAGGAAIAITGTSVSTLSVTPATFGFGTLESGATASHAFVVHNDSAANATVTTETFAGTSTAMTVSADNCIGQPLAPGATCQLTVTFAPTVLTDDNATLAIATSAGDGRAIVALTGHGNPPPNSAPTGLALSGNSVAENHPNTAIGTLSSTDPDAGNTFTYTLVPGLGADNNASFAITGSTLTAVGSFDHETQPTVSVRIRTTDQGGLFLEQAFSITVTDVNEAPTTLSLSGATVAENSASGTLIGALSTNDPDSGDTITYTFDPSGADNAKLAISGNQLVTATSLDHEATPTLAIAIKATDSAGHSITQSFTITVTDVNEAPTAVSLTPSAIAEDKASGSTVGTLAATDPDTGDTFTYALVAGAGATDNASFTLTGATLKTAVALDYETKSSYAIRVRATDAGGLFFEQALTVTITNVNEAPTDIALTATSIAEDKPSGSTVGTLSATDPDSGDTFTFSLVSGFGDDASFAIAGTALNTATALDYETKTSYSIKVHVVDAAGGSFDKVFAITVTNVNEAPTNLALAPSAIDEDKPSGSTVGTLSTVDPDAGDTFTYALVAGAGATDNASFAISGSSLTTAIALDYETKTSYAIRVRTTDAGGKTFEKALTVTVNNVDEAPTDLALSPSSVAENQASGTTVGTFTATDPDTGDTFAYALVAGAGATDNASFTIAGNALKTAAAFDYETKASYAIRVRVTDSGNKTFDKALSVTVTNVNEAPTALALSNQMVAENSAIGTTVGTLSSTDPDSSSFTYALVGGAGATDNASFAISGGSLVTNAVFDYETRNMYSVRIRTTDAGGLFTEQAFAIAIVNVNEAPTAQAKSHAVTGNVSIAPVAGTLLAGATDPEGDAVTAQLVAGAGHGTATVNSDGSYAYDPTAGYTGSDSFTYKLCDNQGACSAAATVSLTVANLVWFVDATCSGTCDGRLSHPFATLAAASVPTSGPIFVAQNAATYSGTLTLHGTQALYGQDSTASDLPTLTGITFAADSATLPVLASGDSTHATLATVALSSGNTVRGVSISTALSGSMVGSLALSDLRVSGSLALSTGTVTGTIDSLAATVALTTIAGNLAVTTGTSTSVTITSSSATLGLGVALTGTYTESSGTAAVTFSGGVTGRMSIASKTGGSDAFSGALTLSGTPALSLNNNGSVPIHLTGAVAITTATSGLTGTGVGVFDMPNAANTIDATGGATAIDITGTIGAAGIKLKSIKGSGVVKINATGGTFAVTGDGATTTADATQGRTTMSGAIALGSGGTLANVVGGAYQLTGAFTASIANAVISTAAGSVGDLHNGISASGLIALTVDNVLMNGSGNGLAQNFCITATSTPITVIHSELRNCATASGVETTDIWAMLAKSSPAVTIQASVFDTTRETLVGIQPNGNLALTVTNSKLTGANTVGYGANCLGIASTGSGALNGTISGSTFTGCYGASLQFGDSGSGNLGGTLTVQNNTFDSLASGGQNGDEIEILHQGAGTLTAVVDNNRLRQAVGGELAGIAIVGGAQLTGTLFAKVTNNLVGNAAITDSGSALSNGILVDARAGTVTALVQNNVVHQIGMDDAIHVQAARALSTSSQPTLNLTMSGNTASTDDTDLSLAGLGIQIGSGATSPDSATACLALTGNTRFSGAYAGVSLDTVLNTTTNLVGYSGSQNDDSAITSFLNTLATTVPPSEETRASTATIKTIASCPTPP